MKGCTSGRVRPRQGVSKAMARQELRPAGRARSLPKASVDNHRWVHSRSPLGNVVVTHRHVQPFGHARNWQVVLPLAQPVLEVSGCYYERTAAHLAGHRDGVHRAAVLTGDLPQLWHPHILALWQAAVQR
jgi:hypothetical protein